MPEPLEGYEILQLIGSGSGGVVYQARDTRTGELCAIKEFPAAAKTVQTFYRELSILFTLDHPHILRCLNLIYRQGRKHYLVLEYATGGSLRGIIESVGGPMPAERATGLIRQVAAGLAHLHEWGIVHRDVKPENVLVCGSTGGEASGEDLEPSSDTASNAAATVPRLKLGDLAVASRVGEALAEPGGGAQGSPAYMAPEQFYDEATFASDLYGLGVIYYELLTGRRPFDGSPNALFAAHRDEPPDLEPITNPACRRLVDQLLAKDPAKRGESTMVVLQALEQILHGEPAPTLPPLADGLLSPKPGTAGLAGPLTAGIVPTADPLATEPSDPTTPSCWRIRPLRRLPVTDIRDVFALSPHNRPQLCLTDRQATDLYDVAGEHYHTHGWNERLLAATPETPLPPEAPLATRPSDAGQTSLVATPYFVCRFDPRIGLLRRLFPLRENVQALAYDPAGDTLFWANARRVCAGTRQGQTRWSTTCLNYYLSPKLALVPGQTLAVSSGPANPAIQLLKRDTGETVQRITVDAPVAALVGGEAEGTLHAVLLGMGAAHPARLLTIEHGRITQQKPLTPGVYEARVHGSWISLLERDGRIRWIDRRGHSRGEVAVNGMAVADAWLPCVNAYAWVEGDPREQRLVIGQPEAVPDTLTDPVTPSTPATPSTPSPPGHQPRPLRLSSGS